MPNSSFFHKYSIMKKIRIGNDIRLAVDLRKQVIEEQDDTFAVRQVSAYLVNTAKVAQYQAKLEERPRFVGRFPREPFSHDYSTTPWCLCGCGMPTYNAFPVNAGNVYSGFGTHPYDGVAKELESIAKHIQYKAACQATAQQNIISVYFPAKDQFATGVYKLVLVATVYAPGYNVENLKTIQVDVPEVFELVATTEEGIDTGVIINTDVEQPSAGTAGADDQGDIIFDDVYVNGGVLSDGNIVLNRTDANQVSIDLDDVVGWYEGD